MCTLEKRGDFFILTLTGENDDHRTNSHRRRPICSPRSKIAGHQRLCPHHHLPGQILLQRIRSRLGEIRRSPIRGLLAAPPNGGIVPTDCRRADLPSDAHRRRRRIHPGAEPRLRVCEGRQRGFVHERGRFGASFP
ncbi:unnamed protein product [Linum tenue]|uniref:Uncharacterized protein n=1 Tax=Linum tenue TaxID=586396 RepID=A0AAV0KX87_9ROSI|nr:unnamed protein product [Linum tenue]